LEKETASDIFQMHEQMTRCFFIIQGEGRGHLSQAMALREYLEEAGSVIVETWVGTFRPDSLPGYFRNHFQQVHSYRSPGFLRTPNRKGIYIGRTLLHNFLRIPLYIRELRRIRKAIHLAEPDLIINFYELLGALAVRGMEQGPARLALGHHFTIHLEDYNCKRGCRFHRMLLRWHTLLIMKSSDKVLALSYRELEDKGKIRVVPPLIRKDFRSMNYQPGERYLAYFLCEGFVYDLLIYARQRRDFQVDVFSNLKPEIPLPPGFRIHAPDANKFLTFMSRCRGVISTAGFDTAAETAFHGIPLAVIPAQNHYEQGCNGADIERSGIGVLLEHIRDDLGAQLSKKAYTDYQVWAKKADVLILKQIKE